MSFAGVIASLVALSPWLAQNSAAPPRARWVAVVVALLAVITVAAASCMHPRRGHRD